MRVICTVALAVSLVICSLLAFSPARAQVDIAISVDVEPPPLPVYDQPPIPEPGYLWVPGYWAWDDDTGYYWVPGTWVLPPEPELLWTPAYWGWNDGVYAFHEGYWGPQIGFYGGVAYGFGYDGVGYEGGYWRGGAFYYNRSVNNISNVSITNVYNKTVVVNNVTNVSYNGGAGGTTAQPTPQQIAAAHEHHVPATAAQTQNVQAAAKDPALSLNHNQGHPTVAATAHAAQFNGAGIIAAHPGKPVAAIAPQGHTIKAATTPGNAATTPGGKVGPAAITPGAKTTTPGNAATTPSGSPPSGAAAPPGSKVGPGNAATGTGNAAIGPGNKPVPEIKERNKGSVGSGAAPGAGATVNPALNEHKGSATGGTPSAAGAGTQSNTLQGNAVHTPTPQVVRPTPLPPSHATISPPPPPPPHAAAPPPPPQRVAAPPPPPGPAAPPRPAPAAAKKCPPKSTKVLSAALPIAK